MASLLIFFTENEIEKIIHALQAQETKWKSVAKKPIQGYGKATEIEKKESAKEKANEYFELVKKISDNIY